MKVQRIVIACALACLLAVVARGQDSAVPARTQRDADNPLRLIIEAGKLRTRPKPAEPASAARPASSSTATRNATAKPPVRAASAASAPASAPSPEPEPVPQPAAEPASAASAAS